MVEHDGHPPAVQDGYRRPDESGDRPVVADEQGERHVSVVNLDDGVRGHEP